MGRPRRTAASMVLGAFLIPTGQLFGQASPFLTAPMISAGYSPYSIAVADFNHDGNLDMAVANQASSNVTVLLGKGNGTFLPKITYFLGGGAAPTYIAAADLNGDGAPDLVVGSILKGNSVAVLLNNGNGTFRGPTFYTTGTLPDAIAIADFNRDGKLDLATSNLGDSTVSVLLGNGDGTFGAAATFSSGLFPVGVAAGDFNGDGVPDLALASGGDTVGQIAVLLGVGDGSFLPPAMYSVSSPSGQLNNVVVGDFNGDHRLDLAVSDAEFTRAGNVTVLIGNGDGTFNSAVNYPVLNVWWVTAADVNGDGIMDLLATGGGSASVLLGKGNGTFQAAVNYATGVEPVGIAAGDFNNDGLVDVVAANLGQGGLEGDRGSISLLLNRGGGKLRAPVIYTADSEPVQAVLADFNNDGRPDLAVANYLSNDVSILLGNGNGTFQPALSFPAGSEPSWTAAADFDGDGKVDVAVVNSNSQSDFGSVSILYGNGDGMLRTGPSYDLGYDPIGVVAADFNGDGKPDLAVTNNNCHTVRCNAGAVSILINQGDGTFAAPLDYAVGREPEAIVAGDLNHDGLPDLVVGNYSSGSVTVLYGKGDGTLQPGPSYGVNGMPQGMALGDLNSDGNLDLVVACTNTADVCVLLGKGDGTFGSAKNYQVGLGPIAVAITDVDGDGKADVLVSNTDHNLYFLKGNGDGTFKFAQPTNVGSVLESLAAADLNGDGRPDVVAPNGAGVMVLPNQSKGTADPSR